MEKKFMDLWTKNKNKLEEYFRETEQEHYDTYTAIVKKIIELVINGEDEWEQYNANCITVIDNGDYQGTLIFMIPKHTYQPDVEEYIFTHNYYGSCSGCDTLQAIHHYEEGKPTEEQIKQYMYLSLQLVEQLRYLMPRKENI